MEGTATVTCCWVSGGRRRGRCPCVSQLLRALLPGLCSSAVLLQSSPVVIYPFRPQVVVLDLKGGNVELEKLHALWARPVVWQYWGALCHSFLSVLTGLQCSWLLRAATPFQTHTHTNCLAGWLVAMWEVIWGGFPIQKLHHVQLKRLLSKFKLSYSQCDTQCDAQSQPARSVLALY